MRRADCPQPPNAVCDGTPETYCLCRVYDDARQRCIDRGEGWRWGVGPRPGKEDHDT